MPTLARYETYDSSSFTNNHNITGFNASGTDGLLVVHALAQNVDETGFEVRVDGTAIDHQVTSGGGGTAGSSIWTTVINDASVDITIHIPSYKQASAVVEYWENVDQTTPVVDTWLREAFSSTMTESVTGASADNELVYSLSTQNTRTLTIASGGTETAQFDSDGGLGTCASGTRPSSTSAQDVGWTSASGDNFRLAVIEIADSGGTPPPVEGIKYYDGSTWTEYPLKGYDGTEWKPAKVYNGSTWQ